MLPPFFVLSLRQVVIATLPFGLLLFVVLASYVVDSVVRGNVVESPVLYQLGNT